MDHTIAIAGAGYVGLVTGACLASADRKVVMVEVDPELPIDQLGLDSLTAAQMAVDIEDSLGVSLFLNDLSGRKTLAELAASVLQEQEA